jgi:hypothetical protein
MPVAQGIGAQTIEGFSLTGFEHQESLIMFRQASQANLWMQLDADPDEMRKVKPLSTGTS